MIVLVYTSQNATLLEITSRGSNTYTICGNEHTHVCLLM